MYALWTKLASIEDVLIGSADDVIDYLKAQYFSPVQQIRSMLSERAASLKRNSLQESTNDSVSFRLLPESDSPFDSLCDYAGFVVYSFNGKNEFTLNGQQYQRGDILIKDIQNIRNSSSILRSHTKNQQVYHNLYKSLLNWYFKKVSYEGLIGLGITYEQYKWNFHAFIMGSETKRSLFSPEEIRLLEMYIISWTKNMNDQVSIRDDARKILGEQFDYVKGLLETQRSDMEKLWTFQEVDIVIKIFEHEIQDEIDALFQITSIFNTFAFLRDQVQLKNEHRLNLIAEIFEQRRLKLDTQASQPSLCQIWNQLKKLEHSLRKKEFQSLDWKTSTSVESLFTISPPLFLDQLGICPESDPFDINSNYIGFLLYSYNDQDEFTRNKHQCQRGQVFIRQKKTLIQFVQAPSHRQTSFSPLFIHEYLYEFYFKEKPNELFQGIGFVYEQGKWKFDLIAYAGKHGIYSGYDIRDENTMAASMAEQYCLDLVLSTLYINHKWKEELGCMYTIDELETIGRELFRKQIEIIEELFQNDRGRFDKNSHQDLKNLIEQYQPEVSSKPITPKTDKILQSPLSQESQESIDDSLTDQQLITSDQLNQSSKQKSKFYSPDDRRSSTSSLEKQPNSIPQTSEPPTKPIKPDKAPKPNSFFNVPKLLRARSTSRDTSTTSHHTLLASSNSKNHTESEEISSATIPSSHRTKEKEPLTFFQLWRELNDAEQKILHNSDLTQFIDYLTKKDYLNYSESVAFIPPDDAREEYHLMARIKIDAQLEFIRELFIVRRSKLLVDQSNQEKKQLDELYKIFETYYLKQIARTRKHCKSK